MNDSLSKFSPKICQITHLEKLKGWQSQAGINQQGTWNKAKWNQIWISWQSDAGNFLTIKMLQNGQSPLTCLILPLQILKRFKNVRASVRYRWQWILPIYVCTPIVWGPWTVSQDIGSHMSQDLLLLTIPACLCFWILFEMCESIQFPQFLNDNATYNSSASTGPWNLE